MSNEEARDIAAKKLIKIYEGAPTGSEREKSAIRALGEIGNAP